MVDLNTVGLNAYEQGIKEGREMTRPISVGGSDILNKAGAKLDTGKVRIELFPAEALLGPSRVLTFGASKYSDRNWELGIAWGRVFGALMRHMWAWWQGKGPTSKSFLFGELDGETNFSHLWHAGCCIAFLIAYEERNMYQFDDRPKAHGYAGGKATPDKVGVVAAFEKSSLQPVTTAFREDQFMPHSGEVRSASHGR